MKHTLKIWPEPYKAVLSGEKRYEVRKADRPFSVGDLVELREWDPAKGDFTGNSAIVLITCLTAPGTWGLPDDLCVFGTMPVPLLADSQTIDHESVG